MKPKRIRFISSLFVCCAFAGQAHANTINKATTGTDLSDGASWDGGQAPGAGDIAKWLNNTIPGGTFTLSPTASSTTSWSGLQVSNATASPVRFTGGNTGQTLSLGTDGLLANGKNVELGDATANTIAVNVAADQAWTVNSRLIFTGASLTVDPGVTQDGWVLTLNGTNTGFNSCLDFNGGSKSYDLSKASIGGPGNIIIRNTDSVTFSGSNTFDGIIDVRASGTVQFATLANAGNSSSFGDGTGALVNLGGPATLKNVGAGGATDRAITHTGTNSNITLDNSGSGAVSFNSTDTITSFGTGTLKLQGTYAGGTNTIAQSFTATTIDKAFDDSNWKLSGSNTISSGAITVKKGILELGSSGAVGSAAINMTNSGGNLRISGGVTASNAVNFPDTGGNKLISVVDATPATLSGTITIDDVDAEAVRLDIGPGAKLLLSGTVTGSGAAGLRKQGDGTLELGGTNTYTGDTKVAAGTLIVSNASGSATSSGAVTISSTGTILAGTGTITGDTTMQTGSVISPGASTGVVGTLNFGGNVNVFAASGYIVDVTSSTTCDKLNVTGSCGIGGTVTINPVGHTFAAGDSYDVVDAATITGNPTVSPATPGVGLEWDLSSFNSNGIIAVVTATADPYADWASQIPTEADRDREDDPDTDGFTNLQEFLFGTSPIASNGSLATTEKSGSNLIIRWSERETGATYTLLQSATLANDWVTATGATLDNDGTAAGGYQPRKATVAIGTGKLFYRMQGVEN